MLQKWDKTKTCKIEKNNMNSKLELSWNMYKIYYRLRMYIHYFLCYDYWKISLNSNCNKP